MSVAIPVYQFNLIYEQYARPTPLGSPTVGVGNFYHGVGTHRLFVTETNSDNTGLTWTELTDVTQGAMYFPPDAPELGVSFFYHPTGTNQLYMNDIELGWVSISNLTQLNDLTPPPVRLDSKTFYHPIGSSLLYVLDEDLGYVSIGGSAPTPTPTPVTNLSVYYVDSVNGSDTNNGSQGSPFRTLPFAYSALPKSPGGMCRLYLIGAGPYLLPFSLQGVTPQGANGQPLLICGDAMTQVRTGTVQSVSGSGLTPTVGGMTPNLFRGAVYHGLTGSSAGQFYQIGENTTTELFSVAVTFSAAAGDTFEILAPTTTLQSADNLTISGPGLVGFWRCSIVVPNLDIIDGASVLFDACDLLLSGDALAAHTQSVCQFLPVVESADFRIITDAGTQLGKTGLNFSKSIAAPNSILMAEGSFGIGYLVSNAGISTFQAGRWQIRGSNIDLTGVVDSVAMIAKEQGVIQLDDGFHRLKMGGSGSIGLSVTQNALATLHNSVVIMTGAGTAAIQIADGGIVEMDLVSGSVGNTGYGVIIRDGGMLLNDGSNTVTGTSGDVLISPNVGATAWGSVGRYTFAPGASGSVTIGAAELWVNSASGNDTNPGTQVSPLQTIARALALIATAPTARCQIHLVGAGPYALPASLNGAYPSGPTGQPLMICGDTMTVVHSGTVQSVSGALLTPTGGGMTADQYRGMVYHGLTGTSAGKYYQIANNTTTQLASIGNTFGAAPGDTFAIVQPVTHLQATGNLTLNGPGKIGFWQCLISANNINITAGASVLFDACTTDTPGRLTARLLASCQFLATADSDDFKIVTNVGTQSGNVGLYFNCPVVFSQDGLVMFDEAFGTGYLVSRGGVDMFRAGKWFLLGSDIDLTGGVNAVAITAQDQGVLELNTGYHRIVGSGANSTGVTVGQNAFALLTNATLSITQAGSAAIQVSGGGVIEMKNVAGSAGNGYGVRLLDGGMVTNVSGNTVTGTNGDVLVSPNAVAIPWANIGTTTASNPAASGAARQSVANVDYTASITDQLIAYTSLTAPRTVTLPAPATTGASATYIKRVVIQDESGSAGSQNILVTSAGGAAVHGTATVSTAYGYTTLYTQGTAWFVGGQ